MYGLCQSGVRLQDQESQSQTRSSQLNPNANLAKPLPATPAQVQ